MALHHTTFDESLPASEFVERIERMLKRNPTLDPRLDAALHSIEVASPRNFRITGFGQLPPNVASGSLSWDDLREMDRATVHRLVRSFARADMDLHVTYWPAKDAPLRHQRLHLK